MIAEHRDKAASLEISVDVEAEVTDISTALGVDRHVITMELRYPAQVGVHDESFVLKPQHSSVKHGHDEQRAVWEPSKAARLARGLDLRLDSSSEVHRLDGMVVEVGEPEPPLVPTWRLPESQPFGKHPWRSHASSFRDTAIRSEPFDFDRFG